MLSLNERSRGLYDSVLTEKNEVSSQNTLCDD